MTLRLLVADDQALVRSALAALLSLEPDFTVVAEVGRGDEVVAAAPAQPPGRGAARHRDARHRRSRCRRRAARARARRAGSLVLTTFGRPGYLRRAMEAGALGFVVKDAPAEQLADAVRAGRRRRPGRRPEPGRGDARPAGRRRSPTASATSSSRRRGGATVADVAGALHLSEGTVRNYLSSAIAKTGARNRVEAATVADDRGWL